MGLVIEEKDARTIEALKNEGVLVSIESHLVSCEAGTIQFPCADGDQFYDYFVHMSDHALPHAGGRHHPLPLNGGVLLLPEESPVRALDGDEGEHRVFYKHVKQAFKMKKIETVVLGTHFPCGAAHAAKLDAVTQMQLAFTGKLEFLSHLKSHGFYCNEKNAMSIEVMLVVHEDQGEKRTWYCSKSAWFKWCDRRKILRYYIRAEPPSSTEEQATLSH